MEQNKIKIYIADELDTINRVCEKFNISKQVLFIFNPLLKNKSKLTNIPIKIPYTKEENDKKESQTVRQKEEISVKYILLMRSALIYKYYDLPIFEEEMNQIKKYLLNNNNLYDLFTYMIDFVEIVKKQNIDDFNNYINDINNKIESNKIIYSNIEEVTYSLLKYVICINKKDYQESSLIIENLTINQISNFSS